MPKFSVSFLLSIACILSLLLAVVISQINLNDASEKLRIANQQVSEYRNELGKLDITDPDKCHIRLFRDRFSSDKKFPWRVYVPDASKCKVYVHFGDLPDSGYPKQATLVNPTPFPKEAAEFVLIAESRQDHQGGAGDFSFNFFAEFEAEGLKSHNSLNAQDVEWMPWFRPRSCTMENPPLEGTTVFDLNDPYTIMKHFTLDDEGKKIGYMCWIEEIPRETNPSSSKD